MRTIVVVAKRPMIMRVGNVCAQEKATRPQSRNQSMCCIAGGISPSPVAAPHELRRAATAARVLAFFLAQRVAERVLGRQGLGEEFNRRLLLAQALADLPRPAWESEFYGAFASPPRHRATPSRGDVGLTAGAPEI